MKRVIALLCFAAAAAATGFAQDGAKPQAENPHDSLPTINQEMLYQVSLPAGLGSNPVGLDRGQLGDSSVVVPGEPIGGKGGR
jgi:hypothetical protein